MTPFDAFPGTQSLQSALAGWHAVVEDEARERLVLLLNHVLSTEPVAMARLKPHAGSVLRVEAHDWPRLLAAVLPTPRALRVQITPAGLLEHLPSSQEVSPADPPHDTLVVGVGASDPARMALQWLSGRAPQLHLQGDARLAADVNWLAENLRWDLAADLERFAGPMSAERLRRSGLAVAQALREAVVRWPAARPPR
jgi:ubiquinone biosynthesis protein UbiJ